VAYLLCELAFPRMCAVRMLGCVLGLLNDVLQRKLNETINLLSCMSEVTASNLGEDTNYLDRSVSQFSSVPFSQMPG
jgi:hypothetical protein